MSGPRDCAHGSLARSCPICERDAEIAEQSKRIAALETAAREAREVMLSVRVFVTTREKAKHPEGTQWFDATIAALDRALGEQQ